MSDPDFGRLVRTRGVLALLLGGMTSSISDRRTHNRRAADRRANLETIPEWVGPVMTLTIAMTASMRAYDYIADQPKSETLTYVNVFGVLAWGCVFLGVALLLVGALLWERLTRRVGPLVIFHAVGVVAYGVFAIALVQGVAQSGTGFRGLGAALAGAIFNLIRAVTTAKAAPARGARW